MLKFKCPKCGGEKLQERLYCDTMLTDIEKVTEDGIAYGNSIGDGEIYNVEYECKKCGYVLENVNGVDELINYLKDN